ncbi:MAG: HAD family phosphatase [Casimicrobiaceae bacterium]
MVAFIFDIDGTIIDSMPSHAQSWKVFADRHGLDGVDDAFVRRTAGRTAVEVMRELFDPISDAEALALSHQKEQVYRDLFAAEFREVAGFAVFARAAKAHGVRLACATAGDADNIAFALEGLGMADFFDAAVGAGDVARGKPAPDLFLLAASRIGVAPESCLVFEDAPLGIEGARRAGMRAVGLTTTMPADALQGTHVLAHAADFSNLDVPALLARLGE